MRVGFALPQVGPWANRDSVVTVAVGAEALGYDSLWVLDRLLKPVHPRSYYPPNDGPLNAEYAVVFDNLVLLSHVAALTSVVRLGVGVLDLPQCQPLTVAKQAATLDQLSGGRLTLGVGAGWSEDEFMAAGRDFGRRGAILDEALQVLDAAWGPDPVSFHGRFFEVPACEFGPKPRQNPRPTLLLGGFSPSALRRAARVADGYLVCCVPAEAAAALRSEVRIAAERVQRNPDELQHVAKLIVRFSASDDNRSERPMGSGSWRQIRSDVLQLADAGFDEVYYDIWLHSGGLQLDELLEWMQRLRTLTP